MAMTPTTFAALGGAATMATAKAAAFVCKSKHDVCLFRFHGLKIYL
jgi:hypothetical protein